MYINYLCIQIQMEIEGVNNKVGRLFNPDIIQNVDGQIYGGIPEYSFSSTCGENTNFFQDSN